MATIFAATHAVPDTTTMHLPRSMAEARIVCEIRPAISAYVADVITGWETAELNARFEAEIRPNCNVFASTALYLAYSSAAEFLA
jgi:hypothetical protein